MGEIELEGVVLEASYVIKGSRGIIRLTLKTRDQTYNLLDPGFFPYFYLVPLNDHIEKKALSEIKILSKENVEVKVRSVEEERLIVGREEKKAFRIYLESPRDVPKMSETLEEFGICYESDIVFWKRYLLDKKISPMSLTHVKVHEQGGEMLIDEIRSVGKQGEMPLSYLCFDIETYNPLGIPNEVKDPVIMISYTDGKEKRVLTTKKIDRSFVRVLKNDSFQLYFPHEMHCKK